MRIQTVTTVSSPAMVRVERIASSGVAGSRDSRRRESRRWAGTVFTLAGTSRQTIR